MGNPASPVRAARTPRERARPPAPIVVRLIPAKVEDPVARARVVEIVRRLLGKPDRA